MPNITKHASMRMSQRCGIQKKTQQKVLRRVFRHGVTHAEIHQCNDLKKWVDKLYLAHRNPNKILLYGNAAYLFKGDILLTVINIPTELQDSVNQLRKIKGNKKNT